MEYLTTLPEEIIEKIISYLDERALVACLSACRCLRILANQNKFWVRPCHRISLNINDIPPKRSFSYFDLCAFAQEWFDAKRRAWKWRTEKIESVTVPYYILCCYRHRIMYFNQKKKYVQISTISENGLSSFYRITFTTNLRPKFELIKGNMNSKYCSISTPSFVIVYKGYHTLNFHLALGILGDTVIDISHLLTSYSLKEDNNTFYFDPISNCGDILFVGLTKYSFELGPIYIVNLKTKNILRLSMTSGYQYEPACDKYLPCFSDEEAIVLNVDGEVIFRKSGCRRLFFNENFIAFYENSQIHIYELATKHIVRSITFPASSVFAMHFTLDYFYFLYKQNLTLYAHEIKSGLKLWEKCMTSSDVTLRAEGGYVWVTCHLELDEYDPMNGNGSETFSVFSNSRGGFGKMKGISAVDSHTGKLVDKPDEYHYVRPQLMKPQRVHTGQGYLYYFVC